MKNQKKAIIAIFLGLVYNTTLAQEHQRKAGHGHSHSSVASLAISYEDPKRDKLEKPEKVLEYVGDLQGKKVLDLGAGTGYFSVRFARRGAHVIAADVEEGFQAYIKNRIKTEKLSNIELRKVEFDDPGLTAREVDIVFVANVYHHIDNRVNYFSKVRKGIKLKGQLIVLDYFDCELPKEIIAPPIKMRVSIDKLISELKEAGFTSFDVNVDLLKYQYLVKAR